MKRKLWIYNSIMLVLTLFIGVWHYDGRCIEQEDYFCVETDEIIKIAPGDTVSVWEKGIEVEYKNFEVATKNGIEIANMSASADSLFIRRSPSGSWHFVMNMSYGGHAGRYVVGQSYRMGTVTMVILRAANEVGGPFLFVEFLENK